MAEVDKWTLDSLVVHSKVELESLLVGEDEITLDWQVLRVVRVDDGKLGPLEHRILHLHAEEQEMRELGDVNGADAAVSEEASPVVLEVLVKDAVTDVVRQQVLNLDRSTKTESDLGVDAASGEGQLQLGDREEVSSSPNERVGLVMHSIGLEAEGGLGLRAADDGSRRSLDEVLPAETFAGPGVAEASCWSYARVSERTTGELERAHDLVEA